MHYELAQSAADLALAYRLTGERAYAEQCREILIAYADRYMHYPVQSVQGQSGGSGAHVLSQTLDEAIWLVDVAWAYDLLADSAAMTAADRRRGENDLLRPAAELIARNPQGRSNWQFWHNAAIGAVGFALGDPELVRRAYPSDLGQGDAGASHRGGGRSPPPG